MVEMDESTLRSLAGKAGLPLQFVYKEVKLFEALSKILTANKETKYEIVLKGDTALNKVYFKGVQRFSEDIDFDVFTKDADLEKIVNIDGFVKEGPWRRRNTVRFHLKYKFLGRDDYLRVEFTRNKLLKTANPTVNESLSSEITGTSLYGVSCYSFDDLVARKMNALRTRTAGKDVWDCYVALPKTTDIKKAVKFALKSEALDLTVEEALNEISEKLKKADPRELQKLTNPYIPTSRRPKDWRDVINSLAHEIEAIKQKGLS